MLKYQLGLAGTVCLALLAGCASRNPHAPGKVSGQVTYKGNPVPGGTIQFHVEGKAPYASALGKDGTYEITDVPTGEMVVTVETEFLNPARKGASAYGGDKGAKDYAARMKAEMQAGAPVKQATVGQYVKIPKKYGNSKTSPLTVTLEAGRQLKSFDLAD
jgi:hypothetical protein